MKFKELEWLVLGANEEWQEGTTVVADEYWQGGTSAVADDLPFGMSLTIRLNSKGKYLWDFGNYYSNLKVGTCSTLAKAKSNAEKAYQDYVIENLAKC